jgi:hypothetical protein
MMLKISLTVHFRRLYLALASSVSSFCFTFVRHSAFGSGGGLAPESGGGLGGRKS